MDDRPDIPDAARTDDAPQALVVHPAGHAVALAVIDRLNTAGCTVIALPTIYDAMIRLAREPQRFVAAVLAVDFFNRDELRFFPMAARRWPTLTVAAVAQPAFAYKTALADLLGARAVCAEALAVEDFVRRLGLGSPRVTQTIMVTATVAEGKVVFSPGPVASVIVRPAEAEVTIALRKAGTSLPVTGLPGARPTAQVRPVEPPVAGPQSPESSRPVVPASGETSGEDEFAEENELADAVAPLRQSPATAMKAAGIADSEPVVPARRPPAVQNRAVQTMARDVLTPEELSALMADLDDEAEGDRD